MLWQAQHGGTAEAYRRELEARGAPIPAHLFPPDALPGVTPWYVAFWELSTERRFAGGPIPWSAIEAMCGGDEAFRRAIREADRAYLEFMARPPEERQSLPPAGPGLFKGKKGK